MSPKPSSLLIFLVFACVSPTWAQVDLSKYFDQHALPLINRTKPVKVEFKWDMNGKSQALLNECLNYLEDGKIHLALANIDTFVNLNYKLWVGHYYRGQCLMRLGRVKAARIEFELVIKINPSSVEGHIALGEACEHQLLGYEAKNEFQEATHLNPKFTYAYFKLGTVSLEMHDIERAVDYYKKCIKIDPKFPDAYMALGIIEYFKDNKSNASITYFKNALKADSTFTPPYFWEGLAYLQLDKKEECLQRWSKYIDRNPRDQFVKTMRGFLNAELQNFDAAFADFRQVLQNIVVNEDKFQGAQTSLDKRIDLQYAINYLIQKGYGLKEETFANLKAGFCLMLMDQDREAIKYLQKAERMSTSPAITLLMAIAFEHGGQHNYAFQYYNKTLEYDNDVFDAHKKRSIYLSELKRWDAAYKDINEMLRIQPGAPVAYKLKGLMEFSRNNYTEAITNLDRFIATDSTDTDALRARALSFASSNQSIRANSDLQLLFNTTQPSQEYEYVYGELVKLKDTINILYVLKNFYKKFETLNSLSEITKILMAQKKYDEILSMITPIQDMIVKEEKKNPYLNQSNLIEIKSLLYQVDGEVALSKLKYENAIELLTASLKAKPDNLEAKYLRAKCYLKTDNNKKALEDFKYLNEKQYKDTSQILQSLTNK